MQNDFLDYLQVSLTAEEIRELRAFQLQMNGGSNVNLRTAVNRARAEGLISTASLVQIAETVGGIDTIYSANEVGQLNVKKGLRTWTDDFGEVYYDQGGFNPRNDVDRLSQPQFNDPAIAKRRVLELGGTIEQWDGTPKTDEEIFEDLFELDRERIAETDALFDVIEPTANASQPSGNIAVDSSWINTIERNGDGTTTVQTYSQNGTRLYTYPDASSNAFDAMYDAHRGGTSVGGAWHDEIKDSGLSELFTTR